MCARCIYIDGQFLDKAEAKVSVYDHGLLYGDGVFEGIRAYNGRVFRLQQHINRLFNSAHSLALDVPMSKGELIGIVLQVLRRNELNNAYVRVVVTRGVGDLGLDPRKCAKPTVFVIADKIELYPQHLYEEGLRLVTVSTRRNSLQAINPAIKSLNYLNNILGKIEANLAGAEEGVMLTEEGYVAEATAENIFIVCKGNILTPPLSLGILEGITRNAVIELAQNQGVPVQQVAFTLHEVYCADECFLTGTGAEVVPVMELDGRKIGDAKPGPVTRSLMAGFSRLVQREGVEIWQPREVSRVPTSSD